MSPPFSHGPIKDERDKYVNVTRVLGRDGVTMVFPYEIYVPTDRGARSCEDEGDPLGGGVAPVTNDWSHTPGTKVDFAVRPRKRGWKGVMAGRNWHGRIGYLNADEAGANDTVVGCGGETAVAYQSQQLHPAGVRYCSQSMSAQHKITTFTYPGPVPTVDTHTAAVDLSINPASGRWTVSSLALDPNNVKAVSFGPSPSYLGNRALSVITIANWTMVDFIARCGPIYAAPRTWTGGSCTVTRDFGAGPVVVEELTYNSGSLHRKTYHYDDTGAGTRYLDFQEDITITDGRIDYFSLSNDWESGGFGLTQLLDTVEISVNGTLGAANLSTAIDADVRTLLGMWNMADDALYPWRTDQVLGAAPLVSRDERSALMFSFGWAVADYGNAIADPSVMPDPGWNGAAQALAAIDPATGSTYVAWNAVVTAGDSLEGLSVGDGFVLRPTAWNIVGGVVPTGGTFDTATGRFHGTCTADGHYAVTVHVIGTPFATGSVRGAPKPAGYQNYFDDSFLDYRGCCHFDEFGTPTYDPYLYGVGQDVDKFNSENGTQLPRNSTQWPHRKDMMSSSPGAWMMYRDARNVSHSGCPYNGIAAKQYAMTACKYAEVLDLWSSQNMGRGGADKFTFDQTLVYTVRDWDPVTKSFVPQQWAGDSIIDATISDISGLWGGKQFGGFFSIASFTGGRVYLGAQALDLPTGWSMDARDDDLTFGKLRFPGLPSLLGRAAITPNLAGTTFTFGVTQPYFGMATGSHSEMVDLWDENMNLLATVAAVRTTDLTFTTVTPWLAARWVTIAGFSQWYMADDKPKGDFAILAWLRDFRSLAEHDRLAGVNDCSGTQVARPTTNLGGGPIACQYQAFSQTPHCLPFVPCSPKVVCISPNGEQFPNGVTVDFPASFEFDERYGSVWQSMPLATMTDLYWQQPHKPFAPGGEEGFDPTIDTIAFRMDDVSCQSDFPEVFEHHTLWHLFYQHSPQVEILLAIPCTYGLTQTECPPTPPVAVGFLDPVMHTDGQGAPGVIGFNDDFSPASIDTAFALHQRLCAAATNETCFQFNYSVPGCT